MKKKAIALALILVFALNSFAFAATPVSEIEESAEAAVSRYTLIEEAHAAFTVSVSLGTYSLSVYGNNQVTSIDANLQLQRLVDNRWTNYGTSWPASATGRTLRTSGTKPVPAGFQWRLVSTVTCYTASGSAIEVLYS